MGDGSVTARSEPEIVKTLRLSDTRVDAILEKLDQGKHETHSSKRGAERIDYRVKNCVVCMRLPGTSGPTAFIVSTRDISATGLSFLHGGFVHLSTRCVVHLVGAHGQSQNVEATVVRCEYKVDMVHEVAIKFKTPIDPSAYSPSTVKTKILLAEDNPAITRLAMAFLEKLNVQADCVDSGKLAVEMAFKNTYDAILMDVDMPVMDGIEATKSLRSKGYGGVIIAATARTQPGDKTQLLEAGCDRYLPKPYSFDSLREMIESLHQEPLRSSLAYDPAMRPLIDAFVQELPKKLHAIEACFANEEKEQLAALCRSLKGEAGGYGFQPISAAAKDAESAVIDKAPQNHLEAAINKLSGLCGLARAAPCDATPPATSNSEPQTLAAAQQSAPSPA